MSQLRCLAPTSTAKMKKGREERPNTRRRKKGKSAAWGQSGENNKRRLPTERKQDTFKVGNVTTELLSPLGWCHHRGPTKD